ncbi:hypothetical protein GQ44DRAFT_774587 [Phaeosphaeriaceae sp. PMI808]|nr:hypothetical protein GQ44DRAFT_774587 [Phaeosphaeriaceae sp. PMI808]
MSTNNKPSGSINSQGTDEVRERFPKYLPLRRDKQSRLRKFLQSRITLVTGIICAIHIAVVVGFFIGRNIHSHAASPESSPPPLSMTTVLVTQTSALTSQFETTSLKTVVVTATAVPSAPVPFQTPCVAGQECKDGGGAEASLGPQKPGVCRFGINC